MSKTIRVSKTEEKIIELIRERKEDILCELKAIHAKDFVAALENKKNFVSGRAAEKNLNFVKRLSEEEINTIWYIRNNKEKLDQILSLSPNENIHKLYNLICHGYSRTFSDLINDGAISQNHYQSIEKAINSHKKILITGGQNTGKTIILNAILHTQNNKGLLIIDALSELQTDSVENAIFLENVEDFAIKHFHLLNKDMGLVLADIHTKDDIFILENISPDTPVYGIVYEDDKLQKLKALWKDNLVVITMDNQDGKKYIKNIEY